MLLYHAIIIFHVSIDVSSVLHSHPEIHFEYVHMYTLHTRLGFGSFQIISHFLIELQFFTPCLVIDILLLFVFQATKRNERLKCCTKENYNFSSYQKFFF